MSATLGNKFYQRPLPTPSEGICHNVRLARAVFGADSATNPSRFESIVCQVEIGRQRSAEPQARDSSPDPPRLKLGPMKFKLPLTKTVD